MKKRKSSKKLTRQFRPMVWTKVPGKFIYRSKDPVSGTPWSYVAKYARTQQELNDDIAFALKNKKVRLPVQKGQPATLLVQSKMTLVQIEGLRLEIEGKTKSRL
jgi:hypothetical protein